MDRFNLLDLDNDVLNIIGDYVKADNDERDFQKYWMEEVKNNSINLFEIIKVFKWNFTRKKYERFNYWLFYVNNIQDIETIDTF